MEKIRIQKIIAESGFCSRRKAEEYIEQGDVLVNGRPVTVGDKAFLTDLITVRGEKISVQKKKQFYYIMLNKPRGYITTMSDEQNRRCVFDLITDIPERLYPVGRLDRNSEGMLLFTNDGKFANDITHPSRHITKTYRVSVRPDITEEQVLKLTERIEIDGKLTEPANVYVKERGQGRAIIVITIKEGRNRQIRRLCEHADLNVARLRRIGIGPLKMGLLAPGEYRELTKDELRAIRTAING
ncbi:MAG: rRNA pseudouridine synthase [Oscillospiraceae bacterium]|jgi:23S rRNA pseudouridine2605 synthase|nr:rRNA pseudouridine synthase [Oscillospiraceae bacterium]